MRPPVFIGGCQRSGTTLLASLIGSHPEYVAIPEAPFKWMLLSRAGREAPETTAARLAADERLRIWGVSGSPSPAVVADGLPAIMADLRDTFVAQRPGSARGAAFVDHTTENLRHAADLHAAFPDARFIHVLRDGRAATASVLGLDWGPTDALDAARWWALAVGDALAAEEFLGPHAIRVRYEDLVNEPRSALERIAGFLGLDAADFELSPGSEVPEYTAAQHQKVGGALDPSRIDAWRSKLSDRDIEVFEARAGGMLRHLGYELVHGLSARPLDLRERLSRQLLTKPKHQIVNRIRRRLRFRRTVS